MLQLFLMASTLRDTRPYLRYAPLAYSSQFYDPRALVFDVGLIRILHSPGWLSPCVPFQQVFLHQPARPRLCSHKQSQICTLDG